MRVRVLLFAVLAERGGVRELVVELPEGATAADVWSRLPAGVRDWEAARSVVRVAVNRSYADWNSPLRDGDEVAFIPPVAGGNGATHGPGPRPTWQVVLTREPLEPQQAVEAVADPTTGAVVVFVGTVRETTGRRRTLSILYEAYDEMAREEMARIAREASQRYPEGRLFVAHRLGRLLPGEVSLVVAVATPHRAEAFACAREVVEAVKARVPIWKKERFEDGEEWVGLGP